MSLAEFAGRLHRKRSRFGSQIATFYLMKGKVCQCSFFIRSSWPVSASPAAPAGFGVLLAHLFASRFAHLLIDRFWRQGFPMTLPWGIDWSPTEARGGGCCLFRRCFPLYRAAIHLVFLRGVTHCHESPPLGFPVHDV